MIFFGYFFESKAFRLYYFTNGKVIKRIYIIIDEKTSQKQENNNKSSQVALEDEAFPTEEVSQSLANGIGNYSGKSRDTSPTFKVSTLMVLEIEGSS